MNVIPDREKKRQEGGKDRRQRRGMSRHENQAAKKDVRKKLDTVEEEDRRT